MQRSYHTIRVDLEVGTYCRSLWNALRVAYSNNVVGNNRMRRQGRIYKQKISKGQITSQKSVRDSREFSHNVKCAMIP